MQILVSVAPFSFRMSLSATIVPVLVGYLIGDVTKDTQIADANPALFIAMGIFALAFIIIAASHIPEPELEAAAASGKTQQLTIGESVKGALSFKHFVLGIIAIFVYVGVEVGIPNFVNLYMTSAEIGISAAVASCAKIGPRKPRCTSSGTLPMWSMWAWLITNASMEAASNGNGSALDASISGLP